MKMSNRRPGKGKRPASAFLRRKSFEPTIEIDEVGRRIKVHDPRLFRSDRRRWCRTLAEAAASRPGVHSVRLDLNTASFEMQFEEASSVPESAFPASAMADLFADSMREADASNLFDTSDGNTKDFSRIFTTRGMESSDGLFGNDRA